MKKGKYRYFGLIGKSLEHSFSKGFFDTRFKVEDPFLNYENIPLPNEKAVASWLTENADSFVGVNVTIPYKSTIIPFLDELSEEAQEIGAVNTIHFCDGKKIGYNTDAYGFHKSIKPFLNNNHKKALILGTGGASKAIAFTLNNMGIATCFVSRKSPTNKENIFGYDSITENMMNDFKIIINCTPLGTFPKIDEMPNFPIHWVSTNHLVIDLIYNPDETKFLQIARENGAETLNGLSMLKHQALKAWELWNH